MALFTSGEEPSCVFFTPGFEIILNFDGPLRCMLDNVSFRFVSVSLVGATVNFGLLMQALAGVSGRFLCDCRSKWR
jgi:hypothetical protein